MNPVISIFILSFVLQIFFFAFAASFKTDKLTDLSYGLTFIAIAIYLAIVFWPLSPLQITLTLMVCTWGIRLITYLFIRILKTKKDKRFDGVRENFWKFAQFWFFQAISVPIIMLPSLVIVSSNQSPSLLVPVLGIIFWLVGISIETTADIQKFKFKSDPKNKDKFIQSGIWAYSRHPNYFGESLLWWGIFVFSLTYQKGLTFLSILGPLYITFLLLKVSGIPPLEKSYSLRFGQNPEYKKYKRQTSLFIPLPKKTN